LLERAERYARYLIKMPPVALRMMKEFVVRFGDLPTDQAWHVQNMMNNLLIQTTMDGEEGRRNGMYVVANYHYLHGFRYDEVHADLSLQTDAAGMVPPDQPTVPFGIDWRTSKGGNGLALDFGAAFVINRWEFGGGVSGVANRIKWSKITRHDLAFVNLEDGSEWVHLKTRLPGSTTIELPVTYTGDIAYHREKWSLYNEYSRGFQGHNFRSALEYRLGAVELRGSARMSEGDWYAAGGAGFNLGRNFGVDVAAFGTQTFLEADRHLALAISFRIDKRPEP